MSDGLRPEKTLDEYAADLASVAGTQYRNEWSVEMMGPRFPRPLVAFATAAHDDQIRRFVDATGSLNPLNRDHEYAAASVRGTLLAPPTYLYAVAYGYYPNPPGYLPLRQFSGLYVGDSWRWHDVIRVDDRFDWVTTAPLEVTVKETASVGRAAFITARHDYYRRGTDELIASNTFTTIAREADFQSGKKPHRPMSYERDYIEEVYRAQDAEHVRGAEPRFWEDVAVGESLPPVVRGPMNEMEYVAWIIAAVGERYFVSDRLFRLAQEHTGWGEWDPELKIMRNFHGRTVEHGRGMGSQRTAWVELALGNWMGDCGFLEQLDVRHTRTGQPGFVYWAHATVTGRRPVNETVGAVDLSVEVVNQDGEPHLTGTAVVLLPMRAAGAIPVLPPT